jgi:hypothetical protein
MPFKENEMSSGSAAGGERFDVAYLVLGGTTTALPGTAGLVTDSTLAQAGFERPVPPATGSLWRGIQRRVRS